MCLASTTVDVHAMHADGPCCDHDADGSESPLGPAHNPDCPHCGQVHWAKPDGAELPGLHVAPTSSPPILVTNLTVDLVLVALSCVPPRIPKDHLAGHPPSSILRHKCVLVI